MGLEIDMGKRLNVKMEVPSFSPTDNIAKELEDELMKFTVDHSKVGAAASTVLTKEARSSTYEDELMKFTVDHSKVGAAASTVPTKEARSNTYDDVDIMECRRPGFVDVVEMPCQDTTESSSSFGDSGSDNDDNLGDDASSKFRGDAEAEGGSPRDMLGIRRKKLTPHWRSFIQPLMWRCKWTELQIKKLESQAKRYDRALAKLHQQKNMDLESSVSRAVGSRTIPFPQSNHTNKVLRRKKRRRVETTEDLAAVMSNHNLFSYYENRKSGNEAAFMDKAKNPGKPCPKDENFSDTDELLLAQIADGDESTEQLLKKVVSVELQVGEMRNRAAKIMVDNADKFSYLKELGLDGTDWTILSDNGEGASIGTCTVSQSTSDQNMTDKVVGDTATTSQVVSAEPGVVVKSESIINTSRKGDLVYTTRRRQEKTSQKVKIEPIETHSGLSGGSGSSSVPAVEESEPVSGDQAPTKLRSAANLTPPPLAINKGKRARRKSAGQPPKRLTS